MNLLDVELHPGVIMLREGSLSRDEQWNRLELALDHILKNADPAGFMINRVVEVMSAREIRVREIPPGEARAGLFPQPRPRGSPPPAPKARRGGVRGGGASIAVLRRRRYDEGGAPGTNDPGACRAARHRRQEGAAWPLR
jgi:hypothetical protein